MQIDVNFSRYDVICWLRLILLNFSCFLFFQVYVLLVMTFIVKTSDLIMMLNGIFNLK